MGVAPRQRAASDALYIAQGYVHASCKPLYAIYDAEFAVVAIVHLACEGRKFDGHEGTHVDACIAHTLEEASRHSPTAHIIVDDAHLHALARFLYQGVGEKTSKGVVGKDINVEMDVVARLAYGLQQGRKKLVAIGVQLHLVVLERQGKALVGKQLHKRAVAVGHPKLTLLGKLKHLALGELVERALGYEAHFACVLTKEYI